MKLFREKSSLFGPVDRLIIELEGKEVEKNDLALLFDAYQIAFNRTGKDSREKIVIEIPSFVLHLYGNPEDLWADLWEQFPEVHGWEVAGCVIDENPYHVFALGLRDVKGKLLNNHLITGHEFSHLLDQVIADRDNNREVLDSILLNPDDVAAL